MKKLDYIIILIVLLITGCFYFIYVSNSFNLDYSSIEILYKNENICTIDLKSDTNITVYVTGKDDVLTVKYNDVVKTFNKDINIDFTNTILITSNEVKMIDASCKNHYCLRMRLSKTSLTPIVCTNGIVIRSKKVDTEILS